jgi:hypothetical protein
MIDINSDGLKVLDIIGIPKISSFSLLKSINVKIKKIILTKFI